MVKIKVHRGLNQIGGCITEIWTDTSRIFIDIGQNLPGNCSASESKDKTSFGSAERSLQSTIVNAEPTLPEEDDEMVKNLFVQNKKEHEAVFYTHGHEDHIGLFMYVPDNVPQYMSDGTREIILTKYELIAESHKKSLKKADIELTKEYYEEIINEDKRLIDKLKNFKTWERPAKRQKPQAIHIGDITITPFYCNHSIFDASMFLIEAVGKRIWHTGDFRNHGFSGNLFAMLKAYATNIDTLIIEGTMLNQDKVNITEKEVSDKMAHVMKAFKYVFVLCSATDIDRLAAVQRACEFSEKKLYVCSEFMLKTMAIFTRRMGEKRKLFHFEPTLYRGRTASATLKKDGFVIALGASAYHKAKQLRDSLDPSETLLIYSNWDGYYKIPEQVEHNKSYKAFRDLFPNVVDIHTSGHADRATLKQVIETINPKEVIGIHKDKDASLSVLKLPGIITELTLID